MAKYRKKPVVIEAVQVDYSYEVGDVEYSEMPEWLQAAITSGKVSEVQRNADYSYVSIQTLEGAHQASPKDYIIRGVKGELYPCKPDIFDATYDEV